MTIGKMTYPVAYLVTIFDGTRALIVMDHTRDLDAVCEAVDQLNQRKLNNLRPTVDGDTLTLSYNGYALLRATLPHPMNNPERAHILSRLTHHMRELRATVGVSAASDRALESVKGKL